MGGRGERWYINGEGLKLLFHNLVEYCVLGLMVYVNKVNVT